MIQDCIWTSVRDWVAHVGSHAAVSKINFDFDIRWLSPGPKDSNGSFQTRLRRMEVEYGDVLKLMENLVPSFRFQLPEKMWIIDRDIRGAKHAEDHGGKIFECDGLRLVEIFKATKRWGEGSGYMTLKWAQMLSSRRLLLSPVTSSDQRPRLMPSIGVQAVEGQ